MHKKKNRERVLAGEMILTFCKEGKPRKLSAPARQVPVADLLDDLLAQVPADNGGLLGEVLFNRLICEAWRRNSLNALRITREEFLALLAERGWRYDPRTHVWNQGESRTQQQLAF
jgi:hypothetical protein